MCAGFIALFFYCLVLNNSKNHFNNILHEVTAAFKKAPMTWSGKLPVIIRDAAAPKKLVGKLSAVTVVASTAAKTAAPLKRKGVNTTPLRKGGVEDIRGLCRLY
jgi:hypothetical protein